MRRFLFLPLLGLLLGVAGCGSTSNSSDAPKAVPREVVLDSRYTTEIRDTFVSACSMEALAIDDPVGVCEALFDCVARELSWEEFVNFDEGNLSGAQGRRTVSVTKACTEEAAASG